MNKFVRKHLKEIFISLAVLLSAILICCVLVLISNFTNGLYKQAVDAADHYSELPQGLLDEQLGDFVTTLQNIASKLPSSMESIVEYLDNYQDNHNHGYTVFFHLYKDETVYSEEGSPLKTGSYTTEELDMAKSRKASTSSIYTDDFTISRGFMVYVPVYSNPAVDGIGLFIYAEELFSRLKSAFESKVTSNIPEGAYLCNQDGQIISVIHNDESFGYFEKNSQLYDVLRGITDKSTVDSVRLGVKNGSAFEISLNNVKYVICTKPSTYGNTRLFIVSFYNSYNVYAEGHSLASSIGAIVVTVILIIVALALYTIINRFRLANKIDDFEYIDADFNCPNFKKFAVEAERILGMSKATKFAVVYIETVHFNYIYDNFGESAAFRMLEHVIKAIESTLGNQEVFGRLTDDHFIVLYHYRELDDLRTRLNHLSSLANNYDELKSHNLYLKLNMGVYCIDRSENLGIQQMYDRAAAARRSNPNPQFENVCFYDNEIREKVVHESEIESKMESAIKNNEFKMFYQPKFNVAQNRPDGAEALVRWFNPETGHFRVPSEFLPIFEMNGFIATMDKYVMVEVCKFISESTSQGYRMVPISVNVSRFTAMQPDFVEYYVSIKRKYGIPDNFLTIEFTESFAYENYDVINKTVQEFHKNGIYCSIDDFGSGYSSYQILKDLCMDELKLDRFFIKPGVSSERDDKLLRSIISLAKDLNMKVTQEGVETVDDLKRLVDMKCNVIQGYLYSRPIAATDFIQFIRAGGTMRIN